MIVVVASDLNPEWLRRVTRELSDSAMVLDASSGSEAVDIARTLPVSMVISDMNSLARESVVAHEQVEDAAGEIVTVCLASKDAVHQARVDGLVSPDFWLDPEAPDAEVSDVLSAAVERAERIRRMRPVTCISNGRTRVDDGERPFSTSDLFHRLITTINGSFDTHGLLTGYVQSVIDFVRCASYCLLWREDDQDALTVFSSQGIHPAVVSKGRLGPTDALAMWYNHSSRLLTRRELSEWDDEQSAAEIAWEMKVFRAHVAVPLIVRGRLLAMLLLGEKALGEPYSDVELETLFLLSNYVSVQLESFRLHNELESSRAYMAHILTGMKSGVVTLGTDGRIAVCNPYAANILGLDREDMVGADLRCLPSPLGDYLYAAYADPDEAVTNAEVSINSGETTVRVSTSALTDEGEQVGGSVMLLDDMTAEIELATERHRRERLNVLTNIVGRIAHEVRTPLQSVKTYSEVMDDPGRQNDLDEFWDETVGPEIDRLDGLINQLVQMVDQPEPDFQLVSPAGLIEQALSGAPQGLVDERMDLHVDSSVPRIVTDPQAASEAIVYLLKYMATLDGEDIELDVSEAHTELGRSVCVTISRSSAEPDSDPDELFDPFRALERSNGDLGPAISRRIIDNQGGRVDAQMDGEVFRMRIIFPITVIDTIAAPEE